MTTYVMAAAAHRYANARASQPMTPNGPSPEQRQSGLREVPRRRQAGETGRPEETAQASPPPTPWFGIAAVLLGLSTSVFIGQLTSIGLSDLRGGMHLSYDEGAWIGAAFGGGQMFMGPLTVYLGGLIGPRRVLLVAAVVVFFASLCLPFATHFLLLMVLLAILGCGSGTFYPLAATYTLRKLPPRLALFGIGGYGVVVLLSTYLSTYVEGWYMSHLSWHWIFWHSAFVAPILWLLVYAGMPGGGMSPVDTAKLRPTWAGFLYASLGFTCFDVLLTQGERLDWFHSGITTGLAVCGGFFLLTALLRHVRRPNPLVNLAFLLRRNILLLNVTLMSFRVCMFSTAMLLPSYLGAVQLYLPAQTGSYLAWIALPIVCCALLGSLALRGTDPRLILATGMTATACTCLWNNWHLSSAWTGISFVGPELLLGGAQIVTICGLVGSIALEAINSGAGKDAVNTMTFVAWFHTVRLLGGEIGAAMIGHLLTAREQFHSNMLGQTVRLSNPSTMRSLSALSAAAAPDGGGAGAAAGSAAAALAGKVHTQAYTMAIADLYIIIAIVATGCLFVIAAIKTEALQFSDMAKKAKG